MMFLWLINVKGSEEMFRPTQEVIPEFSWKNWRKSQRPYQVSGCLEQYLQRASPEHRAWNFLLAFLFGYTLLMNWNFLFFFRTNILPNNLIILIIMYVVNQILNVSSNINISKDREKAYKAKNKKRLKSRASTFLKTASYTNYIDYAREILFN